MNPKDVQDQLDEMQLVDVREPEEWQAGRIPGARWIRRDELPERVDELDRHQPVVTVCRSGETAAFLAGRGYPADNLDGGMQAWAEAGRIPGERPGKVA